jgi:hypothetical protein
MLKSLFKRRAKPEPAQEPKPRGIVPFVDGGRVTIRKAARHVKNTYEIRLGLFMAVQHKHLNFALVCHQGHSWQRIFARRSQSMVEASLKRRPASSLSTSVQNHVTGRSWMVGFSGIKAPSLS